MQDEGTEEEDEDEDGPHYRDVDPSQPIYRSELDDDWDEESILPYRSASCNSQASLASSDGSATPQASPMRSHARGGPSPRRGPSPGRGWPPRPATFDDAGINAVEPLPGKRSRSFTSQLAAQPLHPAKQRSQPSSLRTTSPLPDAKADLARIEELKALIASEKVELARLKKAYTENEKALSNLREMNAKLRAEVARARESARQG